jgi:butyryl-CoA dehydrogenase
VQWTLSKLISAIDAGRWLVYRTASKMDNLESIKIQAAMNKLFATEIAMDTITTCSQLFGERGYDKLSVLSRYMSVAKLLQIVDGTSEIQKVVIGRDLER